eukprot:GEMP01028615.1.p1 GENE.GEMP01028615.1~~GEMP01028615.1.p1  ORF type:complete len:481 (+),score=101.26 GEMP01028615.1:104-1546(+)
MRRVKNIAYDGDDWDDGDWGGDWSGDWGGGNWAQPKKQTQKPAAKPEVKAKAKQPKAKAKQESARASASTPPEAKAEEEAPVVAEGDGVDTTCLVITGHVDAGKSTLMGHLLHKMGHVTQREMHKMEKEANQIGKGDFKFAWVLDEGTDERERGVTIDVCIKHFTTPKGRPLTIVDAPGHRDFVPNMVMGASLADVAVLVVDVKDFDAGFARGGQTKEHLQLVRSLGAGQLVVGVNKMDAVDWDEARYITVIDQLRPYITSLGFKEDKVRYVPISGFQGDNLVEQKELSWYHKGSLIDVFDSLDKPERRQGPLRLSGKIEAGEITVGQKVTILPANETIAVKSLIAREVAVRKAGPGCFLDCLVLPLEPQFVCPGSIVCVNPSPLVSEFKARILVFDAPIPMVKGQQYTLHCSSQQEACTLGIIEPASKGARKLKCLVKGNLAIVTLKAHRPIYVEAGKTSLGRVVLRDKGLSIAAGLVI